MHWGYIYGKLIHWKVLLFSQKSKLFKYISDFQEAKEKKHFSVTKYIAQVNAFSTFQKTTTIEIVKS